MFKIIPGKKDIGAQISCNIKKINKNNLKKIKSALQKYGMIYFRNQNLNSKAYIQFAKNFGKLADYPRLKGLNKKYSKITEDKSNIINNINYSSQDNIGNAYNISAEIGKINNKNEDMILLENVTAKITIVDSEDVIIYSNFAEYNSKKQLLFFEIC